MKAEVVAHVVEHWTVDAKVMCSVPIRELGLVLV